MVAPIRGRACLKQKTKELSTKAHEGPRRHTKQDAEGNRNLCLLPIRHPDPRFHPRMIRTVVGGGGPAYLKHPCFVLYDPPRNGERDSRLPETSRGVIHQRQPRRTDKRYPQRKTTNHEWTRMNTNKLIDEVLIGEVTTDIEGLSRKDTKSYQGHKVAEAFWRRLCLS